MRRLLRALPLRWLPISDYWRTRLWAASMPRPVGPVKAWPYHRAIELAVRGMATGRGYGTAFPGAGDPAARYTMLEFGVAAGQGFQLLLHLRDVWLRRLGLGPVVQAIGFDTFAGMPPVRAGDTAAPWNPGDFAGDVHEIERGLMAAGFRDFALVQGLFADTLPGQRAFLQSAPPIFVAIDCDYYSATIDVFDAIIPLAPHGCLFYFDDVSIDFYSDLTGELRAIAEVNRGKYGPHIQLVEHPLWIETGELRHYRQLWRLVNTEKLGAQKAPRGKMPPPARGRISPA